MELFTFCTELLRLFVKSTGVKVVKANYLADGIWAEIDFDGKLYELKIYSRKD